MTQIRSAHSTAHGALSGLANDDHLQYLLLAGRSGGQTAIGGADASDSLILQSTSDATKGFINIPDGEKLSLGTGNDGQIYTSSDDLYIENVTQDKDIIFQVNDGGATVVPARINAADDSFDVSEKIRHIGDPDTNITFDSNRVRIICDNEVLLDLYATTQDYVKLGDGGDVDINLNDMVLIDGSTGETSFGDNNITNVGDIALDSITNDAGSTPVEVNYDLTLNRDTGAGNQTRILKLAGERSDNGNPIAQIRFYGYDDTAAYEAARIETYNESSGSDGDLRLYTNDGTLTEQVHIHDDGIVDLNNQSQVKAQRRTDQTIASGSPVKVRFDVEVDDVQKEYDPTSNYRFTALKPGGYDVSVGVVFKETTDLTEGEHAYLYLYKNGSLFHVLDVFAGQLYTGGVGIAASIRIMLGNSVDIELAEEDYLEVYVEHDAGANLVIDGSDDDFEEGNFFCVHKFS